MKLLFISFFFSAVCFGQEKKDSANIPPPTNVNATGAIKQAPGYAIVLNEEDMNMLLYILEVAKFDNVNKQGMTQFIIVVEGIKKQFADQNKKRK